MVLSIYLNKDDIEVGIDEVGRGCLYGRVYTASVILPQDFNDTIYKEIKDSKLLSEKKRTYLSDYIKDIALEWNISYEESSIIDRKNIYIASMSAFHKSLDKHNILFDNILVDGNKFKPYSDRNGDFINYCCIIKGDNKYLSIAAASILAKVERDNWIKYTVNNNKNLMKYDLLNNKGYGTKKHIEAIKKYGLTQDHRKTFGICKQFI